MCECEKIKNMCECEGDSSKGQSLNMLKYLGATVERKRGEEESAGKVERMKTSVRADL